jgi:methylenetetrahydrofolate dehydrogenase (NADP+) / methenyltetrahydrofolate cyclohydrolase
LPPVVRAFQLFLKDAGIDLHTKRCIVIGYGDLVGKPISFFMLSHGAKVTVLDNYNTGQPLEADLLLLSTGHAGLVTGPAVSANCHVVDFGSTIVEGKTLGDLALTSELGHLGWVSPSPGGMGPLVVRYLVMNYLGI